MTDLHRDVLRLGRTAEYMNHLETLAQLRQVTKILERSRASAARGIHDVRRPGSGRKGHVAIRQRHMALRIHRMQRDVARRGRKRCCDKSAIDAHDVARLIDAGARVPEQPARIFRQHLHALRLEHHERRIVHRGDLVVRKYLQRRERIAQVPVGAGAIEDGMDVIPGCRTPTAPGARFHWFCHYFKYTRLPATQVCRTRTFHRSCGAIPNGSRSIKMKSAHLPFSSDPIDASICSA